MPGVTKEQIARAKEWDLLTYLQTYEPRELKKCGPREYCTRTHDSLKISNGMWCWNSRGIGGRTALDYLIKVQGVPFVQAVETLCGDRSPPPRTAPPPEKPRSFALPAASVCPSHAVSYLQSRGIDSEVISACISAGTLYESKKYHNCVFVGRDASGHARSAFLRGTRGDFRMDVPGSDKRFHFFLPAGNEDCSRLAVAESPIDALSLATLEKLSGNDWRDCHYLSLGGTAARSMLQYLHDHPQITEISLCLDNDTGGIRGMDRLEQAIREDPELSQQVKIIHRNPPSTEYGKDYNEMLCTHRRAVYSQQNRNAQNNDREAL